MMGGHHAATGAAAWVAVASTAPFTLGLHPVSPIGVVAGALVCAGAALAPDADHHNATIAHSLPPVSGVVCAGVGAISGGHRHGTHSLLGIAAITALAAGASALTVEASWAPGGELALGAGVLSLLLVAFAAKALKLVRGAAAPWLVALVLAGFITVVAPQEWAWLPLAVGLGAAVHVVAYMLTTGGVPPLWPFVPKPPRNWSLIPVANAVWQRNGYLGAPILGNAGSWRERLLLVPISAYALYGVVDALATAGGLEHGAVAAALGSLLGG
jgi:membrane-bound metal-dependent hydrolase YbcI (DUF457 family)